MSIPDSGSSPERRGPAPRKPVRPSIRPFTRTLLDKPFQPFEDQILRRMLASERDFRIFCMFGRPVSGPLPGCERPVVIRHRAYDSRVLRALYLGSAMDHMLSLPGDPAGATVALDPAADGSAEPTAISGSSALRSLLHPLLRDAVLLEVASQARPTHRFDHLGPALATLCFEHFVGCPEPLRAIVTIADALASEGLLHGPSDIVEAAGSPMFSLGHQGTPKGRAHLAEHVLPKWECARLRRARTP